MSMMIDPPNADPVLAERERCIAICEAWIGAWQQETPKLVSAQQWAMSAVEDIIDAIREGKPYPAPGA